MCLWIVDAQCRFTVGHFVALLNNCSSGPCRAAEQLIVGQQLLDQKLYIPYPDLTTGFAHGSRMKLEASGPPRRLSHEGGATYYRLQPLVCVRLGACGYRRTDAGGVVSARSPST